MYELIINRNLEDFILTVETMQKSGWTCQGGVAYADRGLGKVYMQAMVKKEI